MPARLLDALLVAAIAAVLLVPLLRRLTARRFDPFEPWLLFVLAYGVMFVVRPAAMLARDELVFVAPVSSIDVSPHFTEMLVVAVVGAVGFALAYELFPAERLARRGVRRAQELDDRRLAVAAAVLGFLALGSLAAFVALAEGSETLEAMFRSDRGAIGATVERYRYLWLGFFLLVPAGLALVALGLERRRRAFVVAGLSCVGLVLLRVVPLGNRIVILPLIGGLIVLVYLHRGRRPSVLVLAVLALAAVFASALVSDLRGRETRGEGVADTFVRSVQPSRLVQPFTTGPDSEMAPALAAALGVIPEDLSWRWGRVIFGDLVARPIPRPLWDGKPLPPRRELTAELWPVEYERGTIQPEFSALLYPYWDFALPGVLVWLALYGAAARYLYERLRLSEGGPGMRLVYSLAVWFVVIALRDGPVDVLAWAAFLVLPAWLLVRVARSRAGVVAVARTADQGRGP